MGTILIHTTTITFSNCIMISSLTHELPFNFQICFLVFSLISLRRLWARVMSLSVKFLCASMKT